MAVHSSELLHNSLKRHALEQTSYRLEVAVAATFISEVMDLAIHYLEFYPFRANDSTRLRNYMTYSVNGLVDQYLVIFSYHWNETYFSVIMPFLSSLMM